MFQRMPSVLVVRLRNRHSAVCSSAGAYDHLCQSALFLRRTTSRTISFRACRQLRAINIRSRAICAISCVKSGADCFVSAAFISNCRLMPVQGIARIDPDFKFVKLAKMANWLSKATNFCRTGRKRFQSHNRQTYTANARAVALYKRSQFRPRKSRSGRIAATSPPYRNNLSADYVFSISAARDKPGKWKRAFFMFLFFLFRSYEPMPKISRSTTQSKAFAPRAMSGTFGQKDSLTENQCRRLSPCAKKSNSERFV